MKKDHFVYCHTDYNNFDSPLYFGIGNSRQRAYQQKGRDSAHKAWLETVPHDYDYVEFWDTGLTKDDAKLKETKYIREYDTKFNIQDRIK